MICVYEILLSLKYAELQNTNQFLSLDLEIGDARD